MTVDDDKTNSVDNIKVPKFDHSNKTVSRDSRIRTYTLSFKYAPMSKYGTAGGALFQSLAITKAGATPLSLYFAKARSPRLLLSSTRWCKTMMWRRGSKCRYGCFSTWRPAPFATAGFHIICKRYLEQTSSHLISKLKSFVEFNLQDSSSAPHPLSDTDDVSLVGR
jgi:hypothetical protein